MNKERKLWIGFALVMTISFAILGFYGFEIYQQAPPIPSFWNFLGAGVFGFIINPPIALYYVQGLNTTPLHSHTALFGVYGMLGIGLMLFVLRSLYRHEVWNEGLMKFIFWSINIGLLSMALMSLLPVGIWQALESIKHGMWYARSAELMQQPAMNVLKWMRAFGDSLFGFGVLMLSYFVFRLIISEKVVQQPQENK